MGEKGGKRRDETRATFAPVHRPRPPQIVKSCLQLSEILIFSDESFSSFSLFFFFEKHSKPFVDYLSPDNDLLLEKRIEKSVLLPFSFPRNDRVHVSKFCRLIEKFSRVQSQGADHGYHSCYALNQGFLIAATFPRFISRNDDIEESLINFNSPFCSG